MTLTSNSAGGCTTALPKPGFVNIQQPTVTINNLPAYGCAPFTLTITATPSTVDGVASYSWDFGNGNTSTSATPPAQNYPAGVFPVTLSIITNGGCTASANGQVKVGSVKPTAAFTFAPPAACVKSPIQFTDGSSPGTNQWFWDFGDGNTDTAKNPVYSYLLPGTFNVRLTAYNNGCWDTLSHTVVVNPPLADFKFTPVCGQNNSFTFTDNSTGPVTWLWDFNDGSPTSANQNPGVHTFPAGPPKIYDVTLTVTNGSCSSTKSYPVPANQSTTIIFSANPVCANTLFYLTAIPAGTITNYTFIYGDGGSSSGSAPSIGHSYAKPGTYQVKVITINSNGCVDSSGL